MTPRTLVASAVLALIATAAAPAWTPAAPAQQQAPQPGGARVLTLEDVERMALQNHPRLRAPAADVEIARAQRERARHSRWLPELRLRNVWGPINRLRATELTGGGLPLSPDSTAAGLEDLRWFTDVDLSMTQPIYTFGKLDGLVEAAGHRVEAERASLASERSRVREQARELFWGLLLGRELLDVAADVQDRVAEADTTLQERFEDPEGGVTQNDMFKFRIFEYEVDKRHRRARDSVRLGRAALRAITGMPKGARFRLAPEALEPLQVELKPLSAYLATALESRPELRRLREGIKARTSLAESKEADLWPQAFLNAGFQWNVAPSRFDPENPFLSSDTNFFRPRILVGFNWDLNFVQTKDEARAARLEAQKLEAQRAPLARKVRQQVRQAYLKVERTRANLEQSREALEAADNWLRSATQTFDIGIGELQELIDAFRKNAEMRTEHLRNIFEYNAALAELSRAVGRDLYPASR